MALPPFGIRSMSGGAGETARVAVRDEARQRLETFVFGDYNCEVSKAFRSSFDRRIGVDVQTSGTVVPVSTRCGRPQGTTVLSR